jgi:hypothetical protein
MRGLNSANLAGAVVAVVASAGIATAAGDPALCTVGHPLDRKTTPSSDCVACHDGTNASNAKTGHRFDVEYVAAGDLRKDPETFDPKVVLGTGNKVTCLTCHDPASDLPLHLAAPTSGLPEQRLCVACHTM